MNYLTLEYGLLVGAVVAVYYLLPMHRRWIALLAGSVCFYVLASPKSVPVMTWMIVSSWLFSKKLKGNRPLLFISIAVSVFPFFAHLISQAASFSLPSFILPLGLSYVSLQIIAYLSDCMHGRIEPEKNLLHYMLFVSFFPQVVQGPIPRYARLAPMLKEGHAFEEENFQRGFLKILLGLFLKFMIADRAGIAVNTYYAEAGVYTGWAAWLGTSMFLVQLYADFLACVLLSQGAARFFGIVLEDNFDQPFTAQSNAEIWRRWHITLGAWLRDYIFFPLGGSRKGEVRRWFNLCMVFVVSALWHGVSLTYLAWGLINVVYQFIGAMTLKARDRFWEAIHGSPLLKKRTRQVITVTMLILSSVLFRSYGFRTVLRNLQSLVQFHPLPEETGFLALSGIEWILLVLAFAAFAILQHFNQVMDPEAMVIRWKWPVRFGFFLLVILVIMVFGTYGFGYDAQAFIYGEF